MLNIIIAAHGNLARDLLHAAENIIGPIRGVHTIARLPMDGKAELTEKFQRKISRLNNPDGILILIDAYGGSPFNISSQFLNDYNIRIVTGVNLPMILDLATYRDKLGLEKLADRLAKTARRSVIIKQKSIVKTGLRGLLL